MLLIVSDIHLHKFILEKLKKSMFPLNLQRMQGKLEFMKLMNQMLSILQGKLLGQYLLDKYSNLGMMSNHCQILHL